MKKFKFVADNQEIASINAETLDQAVRSFSKQGSVADKKKVQVTFSKQTVTGTFMRVNTAIEHLKTPGILNFRPQHVYEMWENTNTKIEGLRSVEKVMLRTFLYKLDQEKIFLLPDGE